jgi:hypothetical protein
VERAHRRVAVAEDGLEEAPDAVSWVQVVCQLGLGRVLEG